MQVALDTSTFRGDGGTEIVSRVGFWYTIKPTVASNKGRDGPHTPIKDGMGRISHLHANCRSKTGRKHCLCGIAARMHDRSGVHGPGPTT